jgi:hypothetical protein
VQPHTRRALAYIAGRLASGKRSSSVYDYGESRHVSFSGNVSTERVSVFDYEQNCHVGGRPPSLFHYGDGQHISLKMNDHKFSGFDYGSGNHFSGQVRGSSVSLYDYSESQYFNYSV